MKIFTITKIHLVVFVCLIICICGIMLAAVSETVQTNTTPATNKTVVLDARPWSSRLWYRKCKWHH